MSMWAQLIISVLVSALLATALPGRWLVRGLIVWVLSPAIIYCLLLINELLTSPLVDNALGKALFGFMLIASFTAIPWLALCAVGFGSELVLRGTSCEHRRHWVAASWGQVYRRSVLLATRS